MGRRLAIGLVKGLVGGLGLGALFHFGLGWTRVTPALAFLLAMGTAATVGVLGGRPPWRQGAAFEAALKAAFGAGIGALVAWLSARFLAAGLPWEILGVPEGTPWTEAPLLSLGVPAGVWGAVVELDHGSGRGAAPSDTAPGTPDRAAPRATATSASTPPRRTTPRG